VRIGALPPTVVRSREAVEATMARMLAEGGRAGASRQAFHWVLTGAVTSPVSMSAPLGRPPTDVEIAAELDSASDALASAGDVARACAVMEWLTGRRRHTVGS